MFKKLLLLFLIGVSLNSIAQYTEVINSNFPGFSQSPYSVGPGVYQIESNFFTRSAQASPMFDNPSATGINLNFRTGLIWEKLELNVATAIQSDRMTFINVFSSEYQKFGFGDLTFGAKFLAFEPDYTEKSKEIRSWNKRHSFDKSRWIPHVGVYAGVNIGSLLNHPDKKGGVTPKVGILLQNEFSHQYNLITNVYYDYIGSDFAELSYIITATYNFNQQWSGFAEHQAKFSKFKKTSNIGGGLAYLVNNDLHINSSLRATFQESGLGTYFSLGASYRFDYHYDKFIELDEFGNPINATETKTYNKGFFGRLFDKILGVFKKKDRVEIEQTDEDGTKTTKEVKVEDTERSRKKSVLGSIVKDDKKAKKKKIKSDKKAIKKAKKAKKKAKRKAEKAKRKAEKKRAKEERKRLKEEEALQREIQKIEEQLRKEEEKNKQEALEKKYEEEKKKRELKKQEQKKKEE